METPKAIVVAISGYARSGKDTLAYAIRKPLSDDNDGGSRSYANALKIEVCAMLNHVGMDGQIVFTDDTETKNTIRPLLVAHGEFRRSQDKDHWVRIVTNSINHKVKKSKHPLVICIPDTRYENEISSLKRLLRDDIEVFHVHICRSGTRPANAAEDKSITDLLTTHKPDVMLSFKDGDIAAIGEYGGRLAYNCILRLGIEQTSKV